MPRRNSKLYSFILILIDVLVLITAFVLAYIARVKYDPRPLLHNIYGFDYLFPFLLIIPFWILVFALIGLYHPNTYNRRLVEWAKIVIGVFIGILIVIGWEYISDKDLFPARLIAVYSLIGATLLIIVEREILRGIRSLLFRYGRGTKRVLLIGSSPVTGDIAHILADTRRSGYEVVAIAGPKKFLPDEFNAHHYSRMEDALKDLELNEINAIIQTDLYENTDRNQLVLTTAQTHHIDYSFIPGEAELYSGKNTTDVFLGYPMISVYQTPLVGWGAIVKRIFDFFVSLIICTLLIPVFIVIAILQLILNPGPIFYKSERLTRYSKSFSMYKFRSMSAKYGKRNAIEEFKEMGRDDLVKEYTRDFKVKDDPRITKFGNFLRKTSIDELPQFFNVLKGDLSLVGPRPVLKSELESRFNPKSGSLLLSVKSGVTGLWQVSGRSETSVEQRIQIELFYAQNWTFWLDIKILLKTLPVVIRGIGAR